jgi:hypothetical protein
VTRPAAETAVRLLTVGIFLWTTAVACCADTPSHPVFLQHTDDQITISNDYVEIVFDRVNHKISRLAADHSGKRTFGTNLLAADGIRFNGGDSQGHVPDRVEVLERGPGRVRTRLTWTALNSGQPTPVELIINLGAEDRGPHVEVVFPSAQNSAAPRSVRVALRQWFLLGLFDRGAVQYIAGQRKTFTSRNHLKLFYTMDRAYGSVAIEPDEQTDLSETVLLAGGSQFASGIELRALASPTVGDTWIAVDALQPGAAIPTKEQRIAFHLYANDLPFPLHHSENRILGDQQTDRDSAAYLAAIYGSAAGVLGSYFEAGSSYPTLATPDRPYGDAFDFFDPDAWSTVTTLSFSGDALLRTEARRILERSESAQKPDGQMPHHFEAGAPTYVSIAKSSQTGPNIFWVIASSEYVAGSGDEAWLRAHYAHLRLATDWVLAKYDAEKHLLRADGPLFIDVFRRSGYTLDTNVAALYLLDRMAEIADFCSDQDVAARYRQMRRNLYQGVREQLWDAKDKDHFITQRNLDGSTRDLVDYDGNFAALAFGVPDETDARKVLKRMDSGAQTHPGMRGTWVSERRYEKEDCYGGNDGDSDVAMARIWWLDMATRARMGDRATFGALLASLESDLLRDVWMPERYDAAGLPAHNGYYHEYPEILSMVLREMRYGVHVGVSEVSVHPFGATHFDFQFGDLRIAYSSDAVAIKVPGSSVREFTLAGLRPLRRFSVSTGESITTDKAGTLHFRGHAGELIRLRLDAQR